MTEKVKLLSAKPSWIDGKRHPYHRRKIFSMWPVSSHLWETFFLCVWSHLKAKMSEIHPARLPYLKQRIRQC